MFVKFFVVLHWGCRTLSSVAWNTVVFLMRLPRFAVIMCAIGLLLWINRAYGIKLLYLIEIWVLCNTQLNKFQKIQCNIQLKVNEVITLTQNSILIFFCFDGKKWVKLNKKSFDLEEKYRISHAIGFYLNINFFLNFSILSDQKFIR